MNTVAADLLGRDDRLCLVANVQALCADTDAAQGVTLFAKGARSYSAGTGAVTYAETQTPIRATVSHVTDREGQVVAGAITVHASAADIDADPKVYDRLTVGTDSYTINTCTTDALGAVWRFDCRKAA